MPESLDTLWTTIEDDETEEYVDAFGVERKERIQSLPPPSLTKAAPSSFSSIVLDRHTGNVSSRPERKESVQTTPFDSDLVKAESHPSVAPSVRIQTEMLQRNQVGTQIPAEREDGHGQESFYTGYNITNPDALRKHHMPITNRSCEEPSNWHDRSSISLLPYKAATSAGRVSLRPEADGLDGSERRGGRNTNSVKGPDGGVTLSSNTAYDANISQNNGRTATVFTTSNLPGNADALKNESISVQDPENRITFASYSRNASRAVPFVSEHKDDAIKHRSGPNAKSHTSAVSGQHELSVERVMTTKTIRPHSTVFIPVATSDISIGEKDSTKNRNTQRVLSYNSYAVNSDISLDPSKDSTNARTDPVLQPGWQKAKVQSAAITTMRAETHDPRKPLHDRVHVHSVSVSGDRSRDSRNTEVVSSRNGTNLLKQVVSATLGAVPRQLRDEMEKRGLVSSVQGIRSERGLGGTLKTSEFDDTSISDTKNRVFDAISKRISMSGVARPLEEEHDARPVLHRQPNLDAGPVRPRLNMGRVMTHPDTHDNSTPVFTGVASHAVKGELTMRTNGRETPQNIPNPSFVSHTSRIPSMAGGSGTMRHAETRDPYADTTKWAFSRA